MGPSWRRAVAPGVLLVAATLLAGSANLQIVSVASADDAPVLMVTGDIDGCNRGEETAELVAATAGPIATVGDNAYPDGTAGEYSRCYDPTWGKFNARIRPVPGNHDYDTSKAAPYYDYFGAAAGVAGRGWYSYDVGTWHVVALNSNCDAVDCGQQAEWLEADLVAHPSACILAYWHHPRFASGTSGGDSAVGIFWKALYSHGATVILNGHDHVYERFAPMDPSGRRDPNRGIREFIVGTGGATLGSFGGSAPNSEVRNNDAYGVLKLTLRPDGYDWRFLPIDDDKFSDSGSDTCKGTAPATPPSTVAPLPAAPLPGDGPVGEAPPVVEPHVAPADPNPPAAPPDTRSSRRTVTNFDRSRPAPSTTSAPRKVSSTTTTAKAAPPPAAEPTFVSPVVEIPPLPEAAGPPPEAPPAVPPAPGRASILSATSTPYAATADTEGDDLSLAIAGLIRPSGDHQPDRRGLALFALALLGADAVALAALRRGHGKLTAVQSSSSSRRAR